ncbi:MAG: hypothetical protein HKO96_00750, partial [Flavobacteriaceae bacterium]|nr:hypothetical protein [Flavobacteriaceae bacterium]
MSAIRSILSDSGKTYALLIGLFLSLLFLGTAFSSITLAVLSTYSAWQIIRNKHVPGFEWSMLLPILLYGIYVTSIIWTINPELTHRGLGRT